MESQADRKFWPLNPRYTQDKIFDLKHMTSAKPADEIPEDPRLQPRDAKGTSTVKDDRLGGLHQTQVQLGLGPEEHKDLETVVRDTRKAKKAARESEAAQGRDVEASAVQDQSAAGSQTQEDQVSPRFQGSSEANSGSQAPDVPEERTRDGGVQASEGGANAVESPELIDLVSSLDESVVEVKPGPVRAKEEAKALGFKVNSGFAPPELRVSASSSQVKPRTTLESDVREATVSALKRDLTMMTMMKEE
ncbi:Hypothetical protein PHPALM_11585 [Phytophthora palmivora]|uniref:Uncharacterized protein n=1 Tax=Phytophthora palmivora TaxID=4796 RepID=A0A2P4Y1W2_9STRA|nr:Hypothetical protein PHPALM_11585 [Phytophthora palmivora]